MMDTIRDSFMGQLIHFLSGETFLLYPEQRPSFVLPAKHRSIKPDSGLVLPPSETMDVHAIEETPGGEALSSRSPRSPSVLQDEKEAMAIVVDWYGPNDPENPLNWSTGKKTWLSICIMLMTASIYMGSSVWAPAVSLGAEQWGISKTASTLGISLFVLGYAFGPLILSPISEIPLVGRTPPYILTLLVFCILQLGTVYVDTFAGFCVLRFLSGFAGSPPLATGGASLADIFTPDVLAYSFGFYAIACSAAPGLGPIVSGFAIQYTGDWTWAFWEMFFLSLFALIVLALFLPETSTQTILLRRAIRLRKLTSNPHILAPCEIESRDRSPSALLRETMLRPLTLTFTEPIVCALNLYLGLIYATIYSFFESIPLVFGEEGYGWSLGISMLPFITLLIGSPLSFVGYGLHNKYKYRPSYQKLSGRIKPEARLDPTIPGAVLLPISIFYLAWSADRTHWINPCIAITLFGIACDWVFMPAMLYLPDAYPRYAASALASNDFVRSIMGAAMPLASHSLFGNLGVGWGNTIIGGCAVLFVPLPFILIKYGPWLRERSPISIHDSDIDALGEPEDVA